MRFFGALHLQNDSIKNKGENMTKKEKIIATIFIASFMLVIISSIFTIYQLRPENGFMIEKIFKK